MRHQKRLTKIVCIIIFCIFVLPVLAEAQDVRRPTRRVRPISELKPPLPKLIGFVQLGDMADPIDYDGYNYQTNEETAKQIVKNGFQAVQLWPNETVRSQDIKKVICNPGIKVIAIRPVARVSFDSGHCYDEANEKGGVSYKTTWENADFGQIAWDLLYNFGDLECRNGEPLDIILNNWEGDWQAKGPFCRIAVPSLYRKYKVMHLYQTQQLGVEWARSEFPDAKLRVLHGLVINHRLDDKYPWTLVRDGIPFMEHKPDLIGLSYYGDGGEETVKQAVNAVRRHTGYPVSRMYIAEHGRSEHYPNRQMSKFQDSFPAFNAEGIRLIFVWNWRQFWPGKYNEDGSRGHGWHGLWEVRDDLSLPPRERFTGCWTSGLKFLQNYRFEFEENSLPYVEPPVCY